MGFLKFFEPSIATMEKKRDIHNLIKGLKHDKNKGDFAAALARIGSEALELLLEALRDENAEVRWKAGWALGEIGDIRAIGLLIEALNDRDTTVRWRAPWALAKLGVAAVEPLIVALKETQLSMRTGAARALGEIGHDKAVEPLIATLKDPEPDVREAAARALGKIGNLKAVEPLIASLNDSKGTVSTAVALSLGVIGDSRAVAPLVIAMKGAKLTVMNIRVNDKFLKTQVMDLSGGLSTATAEALGNIGGEAVEPLIAALNDANAGQSAAWALGIIGDPRALEPLITALKQPLASVRRTAAAALRRMNDRKAIEPLVTCLADPFLDVCEEAAKALAQLGWRGDRGVLSTSIDVMEQDRNVNKLIKVLRQMDSNDREPAARALGRIGDATAVEPLIEALQGGFSGATLKEAIVEALGRIGDARAVEALVAELRENWRLEATVSQAFARLGGQSAGRVIQALKDSKYWVRRAAASALGEIGDAGAVEPLKSALKDSNASVCKKSAVALAKLG